jgi:hypothetical protein
MLAIILCRIFVFHFPIKKFKDWDKTEILFCMLFWMGVQLGCSHWGRNVGCVCLRIGC